MEQMYEINSCGKYRNIFFTLNNWSEEEYNKLVSYDNYNYLIICKEHAPTTGTAHLHGYMEFKKQMTFDKIKKINPRMDFGRRRKPQIAAITYRKKNGDWKEFGQKRIQGERTDLQRVVDGIESGELRYRDILKSCDERIARHRMWVRDAFSNLEPERTFKTKVIWLYGESEFGKSGIASEIGKKLGDVYNKTTPKWWNRYDGHETVIWNEFCGSQVSYRELLQIMDRYPYEIETKGGSRQLLAKTLVITSRKHPTLCYDDNIVDKKS